MKEQKVRLIVVLSTITMMIVLFIGITYSYFTALNNQESTSVISATSGKMVINYADGSSKLLSSEDIQPSDKILIDKTFTLTGTNTTSGLKMPYKIGIKYTSGFSNGQLHYYIKRTSANTNVTSNLIGTANQTIPGNTTDTGYTTGIFIKNKTESYLELATGEFKANTSNQTITFNLKIQFPDTGKNQDSEKGAMFTGNIVVNYENETGVDYITKLYNGDKERNGLLVDDTKDANIRFSGSDSEVKNYVEFGNSGELWRIIGIFNVIDSAGVMSQKLKLVRDSALGSYSWDTSDSSTNSGNGVNDWTDADLMKELNGDYLDTTLIANKNWYNGKNNQQNSIFNYSKIIKEKYQNMISNNVWNIGGNGYTGPIPYTLNLLTQYNAERGTITYKNSRPTTWTGKVGLLYASDYGYASTFVECHNNLRIGVTYDNTTKTFDYANGLCKTDNWLAKNLWYWTLSPSSSDSTATFSVHGDGIVDSKLAYNPRNVFPTVFLKSNIMITSGTGEKSNPYILK